MLGLLHQSWGLQLVALFPDTFCKTVIYYLKTALFSHNVASTAGK